MHSLAILVGVLMCTLTTSALAQSTQPRQSGEADQSERLPEITARTKPSVVTVLTYDNRGTPMMQGSGFCIREGAIATNYHVVEGATSVRTRLSDGTTISIAGVIAHDAAADLVVLGLAEGAPRIAPIPVATQSMREGDRVIIIGSPLGYELSLSDGLMAAIRNYPGIGEVLQITAT